jgi:hypothetical protein
MSDSITPGMDWTAGIMPGTTQNMDPGISGGAGSTGVLLGTGTGQSGVAPVGGIGMHPFQAVMDWLNEPFKTPLSPYAIGMIVGVILVAIILWNFILYHIRIAAETL